MTNRGKSRYTRTIALGLTAALTAVGPAACAAVAAGNSTVSTETRITNHADAGQAGSLAAAISRAKADPAVELELVVSGPHRYVIGPASSPPLIVSVTPSLTSRTEPRRTLSVTLRGISKSAPMT